MKAVFTLRETNMKSAKEKIPAYFEGEIQGNGIFTITLSDNTKYILDAKNTIFTSDKLLLEGHIANEQEFLGRAVIEVCAFIWCASLCPPAWKKRVSRRVHCCPRLFYVWYYWASGRSLHETKIFIFPQKQIVRFSFFQNETRSNKQPHFFSHIRIKGWHSSLLS